MDEEIPPSLSASFTMQDENIRRIDNFLTQLDHLMVEVLRGSGVAVYDFVRISRIVWLNIKNNHSKVEPDKCKLIDEKVMELDNALLSGKLKNLNQLEIRQKIIKLGELLHEATDDIGIGITVRKRDKKKY